jgi:hypothetical protein
MSSIFSGLNLDAIAEERIQEAIRRGDFDNLPGAGKPLELDDDLLVPPELRVANRILKNAGLVPLEIVERREIAELEAEIARLPEGERRARALAKLSLMRFKLGAGRSRSLSRQSAYYRKIVEKFGGM